MGDKLRNIFFWGELLSNWYIDVLPIYVIHCIYICMFIIINIPFLIQKGQGHPPVRPCCSPGWPHPRSPTANRCRRRQWLGWKHRLPGTMRGLRGADWPCSLFDGCELKPWKWKVNSLSFVVNILACGSKVSLMNHTCMLHNYSSKYIKVEIRSSTLVRDQL
jgi:hypothetical protein